MKIYSLTFNFSSCIINNFWAYNYLFTSNKIFIIFYFFTN